MYRSDNVTQLNTIFSQIEVAASISFFFIELQLLFEQSLYSRVAFIYFFSHYSAFINPLHCIQIYLKLHEVFEIENC